MHSALIVAQCCKGTPKGLFMGKVSLNLCNAIWKGKLFTKITHHKCKNCAVIAQLIFTSTGYGDLYTADLFIS